MTGFHLNIGGGTFCRRSFGQCWGACGIWKAPLLVAEAGSPWYSGTVTCTLCGDAWGDEELMERPFRRGWRQERIKEAIRDWESVPCECPSKRDWSDEGGGYIVPCEHRTAAHGLTA